MKQEKSEEKEVVTKKHPSPSKRRWDGGE